jgi:hypothetical protein
VQAGINGIIGLHRLPWSGMKSVKSINLCESVVQTNYDIVKAPGGELKVETKDEKGVSL